MSDPKGMYMNPHSYASLTTRRERLEATHADLTTRLKGRAAELELLNGHEPTDENISAFIEAQSEHRDVAEALERIRSDR